MRNFLGETIRIITFEKDEESGEVVILNINEIDLPEDPVKAKRVFNKFLHNEMDFHWCHRVEIEIVKKG